MGKTIWVIKNESGEILATFRLRITAEQNISRYKLNKREKLYVEEIENEWNKNK